MSDKIFLHLLILCGIWSQEFTGTFADEEIKESSDFLVREKRVVSHVPGEDIAVKIMEAPYVVQIREDRHMNCVGNILSKHVVITSAPCVPMGPEYYKVISSSRYTGKGAATHLKNVTEIRRRIEDPHSSSLNGVVLLIVNPPFVYTEFCKPIQLHTEPLLPGIVGNIYGWGYNFRSSNNRGTNIPGKLRNIEVLIISHQNCVNRYRPHLEILERNVCTYHAQRHTGHTDGGAPLVVDGYLAGVFLWSGLIGRTDSQYPEVFALLQDVYYNHWIRTNVENIDLHFQSLNHN